jgi:hypothetical protein
MLLQYFFPHKKTIVQNFSYITCVRLCDLEPEQECSECSDRIRYVLKNNKKTEQS